MQRHHQQLNLNRHPTSCFFNLVTTLLDISPDKCTDKSQLQVNNNQLFTLKFLTEHFPKDYYIYFCLNCRLFYSSTSTFSHNCWSMNPIVPEPAQPQPATSASANNNNNNNISGQLPQQAAGSKSSMTNGGKSQSSTANNYFSPIYVKFNVRQMFEKAGMGAKATNNNPVDNNTNRNANSTPPSGNNSAAAPFTSPLGPNGVRPSTSGQAVPAPVVGVVKSESSSSAAFSSKRLRVDSIIEKLKP